MNPNREVLDDLAGQGRGHLHDPDLGHGLVPVPAGRALTPVPIVAPVQGAVVTARNVTLSQNLAPSLGHVLDQDLGQRGLSLDLDPGLAPGPDLVAQPLRKENHEVDPNLQKLNQILRKRNRLESGQVVDYMLSVQWKIILLGLKWIRYIFLSISKVLGSTRTVFFMLNIHNKIEDFLSFSSWVS